MADDVERCAEQVWHVDKTIPLVLLFGLFIQTCGAMWWASKVTTRVDNLEAAMYDTRDLSNRVTKLEVQTQNIAQGIARIETKLDQKP